MLPAGRTCLPTATVAVVAVTLLVEWAIPLAAQTIVVQDPVGDGQVRWYSPALDIPPTGSAVGLPDLVSYALGGWEPFDAQVDPFEGTWATSNGFFRLDVVFDGLVNPPGYTGCCGYPLSPFIYGPNPVFGYIEIDMDADENTGGDLECPHTRYLGNAGRFGGLPTEPWFSDRAAADATAFDGDIETPPYVDRSGEEFHVAFHGWEITQIDMSTNGDSTFDAGETWVLTGTLFHRAHGYESFSWACCTGAQGSYTPIVKIRFSHVTEVDRTTVSLVYPLTNAGSAAMRGEDPEPLDNIVENQNSVEEALNELVASAIYPRGDPGDPEFALLADWAFKDAADYLDPLSWRVTLLIGGADISSNGGDTYLAWTDLSPHVIPGDFDSSGAVDVGDILALDGFIATWDGVEPVDEDGETNGAVDLMDFGPSFAVYDLNYDGYVDSGDSPVQALFDGDQDNDVDLIDFAFFQACFTGAESGPYEPPCVLFDGDMDDDVDGEDLAVFVMVLSGPE